MTGENHPPATQAEYDAKFAVMTQNQSMSELSQLAEIVELETVRDNYDARVEDFFVAFKRFAVAQNRSTRSDTLDEACDKCRQGMEELLKAVLTEDDITVKQGAFIASRILTESINEQAEFLNYMVDCLDYIEPSTVGEFFDRISEDMEKNAVDDTNELIQLACDLFDYEFRYGVNITKPTFIKT